MDKELHLQCKIAAATADVSLEEFMKRAAIMYLQQSSKSS